MKERASYRSMVLPNYPKTPLLTQVLPVVRIEPPVTMSGLQSPLLCPAFLFPSYPSQEATDVLQVTIDGCTKFKDTGSNARIECQGLILGSIDHLYCLVKLNSDSSEKKKTIVWCENYFFSFNIDLLQKYSESNFYSFLTSHISSRLDTFVVIASKMS